MFHLVALQRPAAQQIRGDGGDWGIDVLVGELLLGEEVTVWQTKYFPDGVGKTQRRQIDASFDSAIDAAKRQGYRLGHWTLALPCLLTPAESVWWMKFKRAREKDHSVSIALWDHNKVVQLLYAPESATLRRAYFAWEEAAIPLPIRDPPEDDSLDGALFIKQLDAAAIAETASARKEFFNTDLLIREVRDKAVQEEVEELEGRTSDVLAVWETRYNGRSVDPADDLLSLYGEVMSAVEHYHSTTPVRVLRAGLLHTLGLMHHHVDEARAGWCRRWRHVAEEHAR